MYMHLISILIIVRREEVFINYKYALWLMSGWTEEFETSGMCVCVCVIRDTVGKRERSHITHLSLVNILQFVLKKIGVLFSTPRGSWVTRSLRVLGEYCLFQCLHNSFID